MRIAGTVTRAIVASGIAAAVPAQAQAPAGATTDAVARDVVVTAQRSGIPLWQVTGPRTTVVLVGSIGRVAPDTRWDPAALDEALAKADRVMFPAGLDIDLGLFSFIGIVARWYKQATLPKSETLQTMTTPEQWARLTALRERGVLKPGFERTHPYHLAMTLSDWFEDKRKRSAGADEHVRRFLRRNRAKQVPVAQAGMKEVTAEFFASAPRAHIPCLMAAVAWVEDGAADRRARANAEDARSTAWAERRVADALAATVKQGRQSCWPRGSAREQALEASLSPTIRHVLAGPHVTLAVVPLDALARSGGVLDALAAAGFDVRGPRWRR